MTIDRLEADAIDEVLVACEQEEGRVVVDDVDYSSSSCGWFWADACEAEDEVEVIDALELYDDNDNGRITCTEAKKHGIAPVLRGDPAYEFMRDGNNDGSVC